ncbi:hypothetical protein V6N12_073159 [Hibiscus sabdariffa]|uniref:Uncharacterized protein n=1 Tax=Hibiscus sabdariffa TaxID=183260 RepID=A0ABR2B6U9_9ROSI
MMAEKFGKFQRNRVWGAESQRKEVRNFHQLEGSKMDAASAQRVKQLAFHTKTTRLRLVRFTKRSGRGVTTNKGNLPSKITITAAFLADIMPREKHNAWQMAMA